jgi:hypothetical protein
MTSGDGQHVRDEGSSIHEVGALVERCDQLFLLHMDMSRADGVLACLNSSGATQFLQARFTSPPSVLDYGSSDGIVAIRYARELNASKLLFVQESVEGQPQQHVNPDIGKMLDKIALFEIYAKSNQPPETLSKVNIITLIDVLQHISDDNVPDLLLGLSKQLTDKGVLLVALTDGEPELVEKMNRRCKQAIEKFPQLGNVLLPVISSRVDSAKPQIMSYSDSDLGSIAEAWLKDQDADAFVMQ